MVKLGKVYGNWMVDVQPTNGKLRQRATRIVAEITGLELDCGASIVRASQLADQDGGSDGVGKC